ncbi:glycosyltransferase family 2 protein [Methanoculleus sp. 10]|uniref:glycosyltransferase n=1 Tax=Methanoculleus sp. 10 TaxID=430615 RepID=UPI0025D09986|nr:glycosyltransferase family 2 protein [Methanoculleus sp. 10]
MNLSVIIPTRNRSSLLEKAIQSLIAQTYSSDDFEVIIIDNGSTDGTKDIVESYKAKIPHLIYAYETSPGLHVGRHAGLRIARGDILVYADDDIEAFPTWLEGIAESFEDPSVALVGGNNLPRYETSPPPWVELLWSSTSFGRANGMYSILDFGSAIQEISPYYVWGCNFSIRKEVLLKVGGFHPDGMPDEFLRYRGDGESAISQAVLNTGYKTVFNPKASVYHFVSAKRMTTDYIYKRGYIQGISDSYTSIRQKRKVDPKRMIGASILDRAHHFKVRMKGYVITSMQPYDHYRSGWLKGYLYHQHEVSSDDDLLAWILRDNYFDENGKIPRCGIKLARF